MKRLAILSAVAMLSMSAFAPAQAQMKGMDMKDMDKGMDMKMDKGADKKGAAKSHHVSSLIFESSAE